MRTTLTLDEDLAKRLKELSRQGGRSFEEVTNEVIRRGLSAGDPQVVGVTPFRVEAKACGLKPGVDPNKLNQICDYLEILTLVSNLRPRHPTAPNGTKRWANSDHLVDPLPP